MHLKISLPPVLKAGSFGISKSKKGMYADLIMQLNSPFKTVDQDLSI
jgi:hypothetical protein